MQLLKAHPDYQNEFLLSGLKRLLGDFDPRLLARALQGLEWVELAGGELLFEQGSPGEEIYFLVSGRLQATIRSGRGEAVVAGRMGRGAVIGEISLITGEPHTARVTAIRPSVLVRLPRAGFHDLVREHPSFSLHLTRVAMERMRRAERRALAPRDDNDISRPVNVALVPVTRGVDVPGLSAALSARLPRWGRTLLLTREVMEERFGKRAIEATRENAADAYLQLTAWLDEAEAQHDFVLFAADDGDTAWTRRCLSHADEVILFADAAAGAGLHPVERSCLGGERPITGAPVRFAIVHEPGTSVPAGTSAMLAARQVSDHVHLRRGLARDLDRLARVIARRATGLVLSGGAARGFAHLGAYRALVEAGVEVDCVGATSMGAGVGALIALDVAPAEAIRRFRQILGARPVFRDYNLLPFVSLLTGRRLEAHLEAIYARPDGTPPDIEDTWKSFFCVAASYSHARETVLRRGPLAKLVRASLSVPVFLPPVLHGGELLIDGGLLNNFPVDVMAQDGVARLLPGSTSDSTHSVR